MIHTTCSIEACTKNKRRIWYIYSLLLGFSWHSWFLAPSFVHQSIFARPDWWASRICCPRCLYQSFQSLRDHRSNPGSHLELERSDPSPAGSLLLCQRQLPASHSHVHVVRYSQKLLKVNYATVKDHGDTKNSTTEKWLALFLSISMTKDYNPYDIQCMSMSNVKYYYQPMQASK